MESKPGCSKDGPTWDEEMLKQEPVSEELSGSHGMLDLSDDVLLYILKHCSPQDLKALGFTCMRLGRLVCDRVLWSKVDARDCGVGRAQLAWYLTHAASHHTTSLALSGFARQARGCLGTVDARRPLLEAAARETPAPPPAPAPPPGPSRQPSCFHFARSDNPQLPRFNVSPVWRDSREPPAADEDTKPDLKNTGGCRGPRWTLSVELLSKLRTTCPGLNELRLEYVNINCEATPIAMFPPTLLTLSLRGSRCYNLKCNKSFLFRMHDFMPLLEEVDISECGWMDPATLLPLSKLPSLRKLYLERCRRLSECVAYASLAARYGFRALKVLSLLGTPIGDSEVSGLGWLPVLEELYLEPAEPHDAVDHHSHYLDDPRAAVQELEPWEKQEPPYFCAAAGTEPACDACAEPAASGSGVPAPPADRKPKLTYTDPYLITLRHPGRGNVRRLSDLLLGPQELRGRRDAARSASRDAWAGPSRDAWAGPSRTLTRSQTLQERERAAGPSASTRSKKPQLSPAAAKRSRDPPADRPVTKRRRTQSAEPDAGASRPRRRSVQGGVDGDAPERNERSPRSLRGRDGQNNARQRRSGGRNEQNGGADDAPNGGGVERGAAGGAAMRAEHPAYPRRDIEREEEDYGEGRVHVIYVNVRRPRHEVYRMLVQDEDQRAIANREELERAVLNVVEMPRREAARGRPDALRDGPEFAIAPNPLRAGVDRDSVINILRMPFIQNFLYRPTEHVAAASLVSDTAITRFGRSDNADAMNYVHIGPNGAVRAGRPPPHQSDRPEKSKLRTLVCRGYSGITNRSLIHLVTAAPDLRLLDVTGTKVTEEDALAFKSLRPECEIKYSPKVVW